MTGRRDPAGGLARYLPAVGWLGGYQRGWLRGDLAAGVLGLGFMADFISAPVLTGFKAGVGLLIAAGQLGKVLGVPLQDGDFFVKVGSALAHLGDLNWPTFLLAVASIAILLGLRRWAPPSLPGPLLVVALGILLAATTGLADRGVALVGTIPPGLPEFAAPDLAMVGGLLGPAAGVALMAFVESIAAGRAFAARGDPEVDADQELRALGAANLAAGCFQGFPAGGGLALVALAAVPVLGVLQGVLLSVIVSMLTLIHGANHPPIEVLGRMPGRGTGRDLDRHPDGQVVPGLLALRPVGPIYFANAPRLGVRLLRRVDAADPPPKVLVMDLGAVPDIDVTVVDLLAGFDAELRERGVTLWLADLNARPLDMLRRLRHADAWERRLFLDLDDAATAFAASHSSSSGDDRPAGPPPP
jgi:sulfate permease, SulP family